LPAAKTNLFLNFFAKCGFSGFIINATQRSKLWLKNSLLAFATNAANFAKEVEEFTDTHDPRFYGRDFQTRKSETGYSWIDRDLELYNHQGVLFSKSARNLREFVQEMKNRGHFLY
jgi:hypothetical protein